jgi:hypothetical protein
MAVEIVTSRRTQSWLNRLTPVERGRIVPVIEALQRHGPDLPRRLSKPIKTSRHPGMRELRATVGNIRVLYARDRLGRAVLLAGGDKTGDWAGWYERQVPVADHEFDDHQRRLGKEPTCRRSLTGARAWAR